jgi:hypothetical protein
MRLNRLLREEKGISTVIVAVSLIGIFGATMLSLDAGNMWQTRRKIISGTDSTVLRQAKSYAQQSVPGAPSSTASCPTGVSDSWTDWLTKVGGAGTTPMSCNVTWGVNGTGYVVVEGSKLSETRFGGLLGIGDTHPYSLSAASFGYLTEAEGLRPMGICANNDHFKEWVSVNNGTMAQTTYNALRNSGPEHPTDDSSAPTVIHRLIFNNGSPSGCGGTYSGNWGWIDFDAGANCTGPSKHAECIRSWILYGYGNTVGIGDCYADNTNEFCEGNPGSGGGSVSNALDQLIADKTIFPIPIYDQGNTLTGGNAEFNMFAFVGVRLWKYKVTGKQEDRYFDFEFVNLQTSGTCCTKTGLPGTAKGTTLCGVDHDKKYATQAAALAARCLL